MKVVLTIKSIRLGIVLRNEYEFLEEKQERQAAASGQYCRSWILPDGSHPRSVRSIARWFVPIFQMQFSSDFRDVLPKRVKPLATDDTQTGEAKGDRTHGHGLCKKTKRRRKASYNGGWVAVELATLKLN
jgi:hypothetical protein